jgi:hypothetical protein
MFPEGRKFWTRQPDDYRLPLDVNKHGRYTKVLWLYTERRHTSQLRQWLSALQWGAVNHLQEDVRKIPLKYWKARRLARKMAEAFRAARIEKKKARKAKKQWARIGCQTYAQWQESMGLHTSTFCED